jgi:hypothetical protein
MGRIARRVPVDFDWPLRETWDGYLMPKRLHERECEACEGSGYSPEAQRLRDKWYSNGLFDPAETGSTSFTPDTPEVRAFAERNVSNSPEFYGTGEAPIRREAQRLANLWNGAWSHHLAQEDVDVLVEAGRLHDFTHDWIKGQGWVLREPAATVTAADVNRWSLSGFGHDSLNCSIVVEAKCKRDGLPYLCAVCGGHGSIERWTGQRAEAEAWEPTEPPTGDGWQMWENTSEGSPISPVFDAAGALAEWLAVHETTFGSERASSAEWLRIITGEDFAHVQIAPGVIVM